MANLRIAELDFDAIKANLKTYLQSQSEFSDYDFEGSGLSVLLDILSYNTHYNAYLANMLMNEMFLDSAVKRSSAVSIAKHLGYTPRSARGAKATVDITVNSPTDSPSTLTLPRYTTFTSSVNGTTYSFVNLDAITIAPSGGVYTFSDVVLTQGSYYSFSYTVSSPGPTERYEIPNDNVDTTTIRVTVQSSSSDATTSVYTLSTDITQLTSTSKVFFLQENASEKYEIYFGDGLLGKKLSAGNIVTIEYLLTDGSDANVSSLTSQSFAASSTIGGSSDITITVSSNSTGGAAKEGIDSIKFNAPLADSARNRAVTSNDYLSLLLSNVPEAESISVWGGETNDPPIYGKVIIALKPYAGFTISQTTRDSITENILKNKRVLAIQPLFVEPDYFYVSMELSVKYNPNLTNYNSDEIKTVVRNTVTSYFNNNLGKFDQDFYTSRLQKEILNSDTSIISVSPEVRLQKRITPTLNTPNTYTNESRVKFYNRLHPGRFSSSFFYVAISGTSTLAKIVDVPDTTTINYDGTGTLKLLNAVTDVVLDANFGTIDYRTGDVSITELTPIALPSTFTSIRLSCELQEASYDISALRNQILELDESTLQANYGIAEGLTINVSEVIE